MLLIPESRRIRHPYKIRGLFRTLDELYGESRRRLKHAHKENWRILSISEDGCILLESKSEEEKTFLGRIADPFEEIAVSNGTVHAQAIEQPPEFTAQQFSLWGQIG